MYIIHYINKVRNSAKWKYERIESLLINNETVEIHILCGTFYNRCHDESLVNFFGIQLKFKQPVKGASAYLGRTIKIKMLKGESNVRSVSDVLV